MPTLLRHENLLDASEGVPDEFGNWTREGPAPLHGVGVGRHQHIARITYQQHNLAAPPDKWIGVYAMKRRNGVDEPRTVMGIGNSREAGLFGQSFGIDRTRYAIPEYR